ncbi:MAG: hypothetical protein V7K68_32230 [Nostoc sp.]|uniref:hypothetical protein n=1 Tax=Nostoc sp. TaxID=1180 RepID=UPI002FFCDEE4
MNNICGCVKGLGVVIAGLIAISGNSAIAAMNQGITLPENYNTLSGEQTSDVNYSINKKTQTKGKNPVEKQEIKKFVKTIQSKKILLAGCIITNQGMICG